MNPQCTACFLNEKKVQNPLICTGIYPERALCWSSSLLLLLPGSQHILISRYTKWLNRCAGRQSGKGFGTVPESKPEATIGIFKDEEELLEDLLTGNEKQVCVVGM